MCHSLRHLGICLLAAASLALCATSSAQTRQRVGLPPVTGKYTLQQSVDVGDVPGHQLRVFELHRQYGADAPLVAGSRIKESWTHGLSDYVELNGQTQVNTSLVLESGDRIFARGSLVAQATPSSEGKNATRTVALLHIHGGSGKCQGMRGLIRSETVADIAAGINVAKGELEYWFDRQP